MFFKFLLIFLQKFKLQYLYSSTIRVKPIVYNCLRNVPGRTSVHKMNGVHLDGKHEMLFQELCLADCL